MKEWVLSQMFADILTIVLSFPVPKIKSKIEGSSAPREAGGGGRSGSLGLEPVSGVPEGDERWWLEAASDLQTCSGKGNKYLKSVRRVRWRLEEGKASSSFSYLCQGWGKALCGLDF